MSEEEVFVGDVGTQITLDCGIDVSSATVRKILVKRPNGSRAEWVAVASGGNAIAYTTQAADLNMAGVWELQAYVEMPAWRGRGGWAKLKVLP